MSSPTASHCTQVGTVHQPTAYVCICTLLGACICAATLQFGFGRDSPPSPVLTTQAKHSMSSSATVSPPCKRPRLASPHSSYRGHDSINAVTLASHFQHAHSQPPTAAEIQGDGRWNNRSPRGARRPEYELAYTFKGHTAGVSSVKFSPDGKWIASCCKTTLAVCVCLCVCGGGGIRRKKGGEGWGEVVVGGSGVRAEKRVLIEGVNSRRQDNQDMVCGHVHIRANPPRTRCGNQRYRLGTRLQGPGQRERRQDHTIVGFTVCMIFTALLLLLLSLI